MYHPSTYPIPYYPYSIIWTAFLSHIHFNDNTIKQDIFNPVMSLEHLSDTPHVAASKYRIKNWNIIQVSITL